MSNILGAQPKAKFSVLWKIDWSAFNQLSTKPIYKYFTTAYNDVVFYWRSRISALQSDNEKFSLSIRYADGPPAYLENIVSKILVRQAKSGGKIFRESEDKDMDRGKGFTFLNVFDRNADIFQQQYGFTSDEALLCQVTLKIPISAFSFAFNNPLTAATSSEWTRNLFNDIGDPEKAKFSNAKIISRDGVVFYCHKLILEYQSAALEAMFRFPGEGQEEEKFRFRDIGADAMEAMLEFLYTGKTSFAHLSTTSILELVDASEQYGLKKLKQGCRAVLWNRVVEKPGDSFNIIRAIDLHEDMKYVKDRALEVLARNYETFFQNSLLSLAERFGGDELGNSFLSELNLYFARRLEGYFGKY